MDATILLSFVDYPKGKKNKGAIRYKAGDVVSMSKEDFDRIQSQSNGRYLKEGRFPFGDGTCYPCQKSKNATEKTTTKVVAKPDTKAQSKKLETKNTK